MTYVIGIDPGVHTGFAVWDSIGERFDRMVTLKIDIAMEQVAAMHDRGEVDHVVFEDARLRRWYGNHSAETDRARLQGAGSIKRDCTIWQDFLTRKSIPHTAVAPQAGSTKWTKENFERITGWTKKTSEHARDAALLVVGRKVIKKK